MGGSPEASPGKNAELRTDADANTLDRPDGYGLTAGGQLTLGSQGLTALRFRSVRHFTLDFHSTPPRGSRLIPPAAGALVSSVLGFLRQDPRGLSPPVLCPCRAHFLLRGRGPYAAGRRETVESNGRGLVR